MTIVSKLCLCLGFVDSKYITSIYEQGSHYITGIAKSHYITGIAIVVEHARELIRC